MFERMEKAYEYYEKRINCPKQGYKDEITNSYFNCGLLGAQYLNWPWEKIEQYYMKAHEHEPRKPDSIYQLGIHYIDEGQIEKGYKYLVDAFNLGFPTCVNMNLRPYIYNKTLPEIILQYCYQFGDYELGIKACERYLLNNPPNEMVVSWYNIFQLFNKKFDLKKYNFSKFENNNKLPKICFVADGGYNKWSGRDLHISGVGGSETYVIQLARNLAKTKLFDIYVFCNCEQNEIFEDVFYINIESYIPFLKKYPIHTCFVSRYAKYLPVTYKLNTCNVYLVLHDVQPIGNVIPIENKLRGVLCVSEWQKNIFLEGYPLFKDNVHVFPNGIDISQFDITKIKKKPFSFIYSSFPNRGLINLLRMFPLIKQKFPKATLNIFCDLKNSYVQEIAKDEMNEIEKLIEQQSEYVTNHGWVSKTVLYHYWLESEVWLYPCTFQETFCITALEAAVFQNFSCHK